MSFAFHFESSGRVDAVPPLLFEHLDDPRRLAAHMETGSAAMAGASMSIDTDEQQGRAVGSLIRMHGRMLGMPLFLEERVTQRQPPQLKSWETCGEPRLLVIAATAWGFASTLRAQARC